MIARRPSIPDLLPLLAAIAVAAAAIAPSRDVADRGDLILAALVALTALGTAPARLWRLRRRWRAVLVLSLAPLAILAPLAWALSRLFDGPVRDGTLALGLSCTEVAAVGLVALAGGDAALALAALTGSLVAAAIAGPLLIGALADPAAGADPADLLGRFALVVLVPLAAGLAARARWPRLDRAAAPFAAASTLTVAALIYAALSGARGGDIVPALAASAAFLGLSALPALAWWRLAPRDQRSAGALAIGLRDFAVAAALAGEAFGPSAAVVSGVYGVLMLLAGAVAAVALRYASGAAARASAASVHSRAS